jgi:hypothetical protein
MRKNTTLKHSLIRIGWLSLLTTAFFCFTASAQEKPEPVLIDSFNYSNSEDASARIDLFRNELERSPQNAGLVIVYGGQKSKRGEIEAHLRGIKKAFALKRIDHNRSPVRNGGYREKLTVEFWIIPIGANSPEPTPTVEVKKVRFKGVSPKSIPYECCF